MKSIKEEVRSYYKEHDSERQQMQGKLLERICDIIEDTDAYRALLEGFEEETEEYEDRATEIFMEVASFFLRDY